jgi:hypothetical protein
MICRSAHPDGKIGRIDGKGRPDNPVFPQIYFKLAEEDQIIAGIRIPLLAGPTRRGG